MERGFFGKALVLSWFTVRLYEEGMLIIGTVKGWKHKALRSAFCLDLKVRTSGIYLIIGP